MDRLSPPGHAALVQPTAPVRPVPAGACDCHAHIFGPFDRFPLPAQPLAKALWAPFDNYREMLSRIGFERAVLVQPSAYGEDDRALIDALRRRPAETRGISVKTASVTDADLDVLHTAGVRGLRFNQLVGRETAIGFADLFALAPRLSELGWHAQIYAGCDELAAQLPALLKLRIPLVFDHLARVGPGRRAVSDPAFQTILNALRGGSVWIKLTAYRNGAAKDSFEDVRPFHDAFVAANPDRMVWGTDWPFLSADPNPPDAGRLVDTVTDWVGDEGLMEKILTTNPSMLYGF
jgi:predicted TIM-barrel fold metal-dependent hydrolase